MSNSAPIGLRGCWSCLGAGDGVVHYFVCRRSARTWSVCFSCRSIRNVLLVGGSELNSDSRFLEEWVLGPDDEPTLIDYLNEREN